MERIREILKKFKGEKTIIFDKGGVLMVFGHQIRNTGSVIVETRFVALITEFPDYLDIVVISRDEMSAF